MTTARRHDAFGGRSRGAGRGTRRTSDVDADVAEIGTGGRDGRDARARRATRARTRARRGVEDVEDVDDVVAGMEAILAAMRAAQGVEGISEGNASDDETRDAATTTPAGEAGRHRAMQTVCAEFAASAGAWLGGRWYQHFESWLYSRRGGDADADAFPRGEDAERDAVLARKLRASGASDGEATRICRRLAKASENARRAAASAEASTRFNAKANRVRRREFEVGGDKGVRKVELSCGKVKLEVNARHYAGLRRRFEGRADDEAFHRAAFCLLARYACLQGTHYKAGNMQAAVPTGVLDVLRERFGVRCEMFASPLNAYLEEYCSAVPATDRQFGSLGSAFDYEPEEGSFECNPPFDEEFISRLAGHLERLLAKNSKKPLSFCVIVPKWLESRGWKRMAKSVYCTSNTSLEAKEHAFISGAQHSRVDQMTASAAATSVIFLQNRAGERKWPVTADAIDMIRAAFSSIKSHTPRDVEKWDPDAPLGLGTNTRRLPAGSKSWVYASKRQSPADETVETPAKKKKKSKKVANGAISADFFRD